MIKSFGDALTQSIYNQRPVKAIPPHIVKSAYRKLLRIEVAPSLRYLTVPPANRLEKLKGDLAGFWSIRINDQYRIIFQWDGDAHNVRVVDYH